MAEVLFITPEYLVANTILRGNVDPDNYAFEIANVQVTVIEPLLGTLLYDKIKTDFQADTLAGNYETIFNEFVKPIVKHRAVANYIETAGFMLSNGGLFKHSPENAEVVSMEEARSLASRYEGYAQGIVLRFEKWICKNTVTEYKRYQDEVNARTISNPSGWYLKENYVPKWYLDDPS